jgi:hypothetical protein
VQTPLCRSIAMLIVCAKLSVEKLIIHRACGSNYYLSFGSCLGTSD